MCGCTYGTVGLGRRIELETFDIKAFVELFPNIGTQSVSDSLADRMLSVQVAFGLIDKKTTDLTDIDERRALIAHTFAPELRCGELAAQHNRVAVHQCRTHAYHATVAVINWQRDHDNIACLEMRRCVKCYSAGVVSALLHYSRLWQACRTARVYIQNSVFKSFNILSFISKNQKKSKELFFI